MTERTATPRQGGSTVGKPSTSTRRPRYTTEQLEVAATWLSGQGNEPWAKRFKIEGDNIYGDLRGTPPAVRQMVRDLFDALQLMTKDQLQQFLAADLDRTQLVDQVLTEAGR